MIDYSYEILDLLNKYDGNVQAALEGEKTPQCLYAFSSLRENLLEWVELEPGARVLQIGSDYGSVTGLLGKRAGEVVVFDELDENLEVNRLRHGTGKNGTIRYVRGVFAGAESDCPQADLECREYPPKPAGEDQAGALLEKSFDYIILIGYLERHRKEDAEAILKAAADYLKPGGTLIAAAENDMGIRYWMGAEKFPVSFLEPEFRGLFESLNEIHGGSFTMYYPVPDYRYPVTVYSDHYLPGTGDVTNISARLDGPGFWFGNEEEAMAKVCQNGAFTKFANSFLGVWEKGNL